LGIPELEDVVELTIGLDIGMAKVDACNNRKIKNYFRDF